MRFLQNAVRTGQVPHALILCGERGIGKMELAMAFAAALQCTAPLLISDDGSGKAAGENSSQALTPPAAHSRSGPDGTEVSPGGGLRTAAREKEMFSPTRIEPCGCCRACRQIEAGSHPDVIEVTNERAGADTKTGTLGVKTARFVQADVCIKPYEGPWKIYIIPDAHRMNPQAQNALLKTLEEPPAYVVMILLAESTDPFLPTVLSRCITLRLHPVGENDLVTDLVNRSYEVPHAVLCARLSHGNPGRCRQLAGDEALWQFRTDFIGFMKRMPEVNSYEIVQYAESLTAKDVNRADDFMDFGLSWFRDILTAKGTDAPGAGTLIFADEITYINEVKDLLSYQALERILRSFDDAARRRASNGNDAQIIEVLLLNIRRAMHQR